MRDIIFLNKINCNPFFIFWIIFHAFLSRLLVGMHQIREYNLTQGTTEFLILWTIFPNSSLIETLLSLFACFHKFPFSICLFKACPTAFPTVTVRSCQTVTSDMLITIQTALRIKLCTPVHKKITDAACTGYVSYFSTDPR